MFRLKKCLSLKQSLLVFVFSSALSASLMSMAQSVESWEVSADAIVSMSSENPEFNIPLKNNKGERATLVVKPRPIGNRLAVNGSVIRESGEIESVALRSDEGRVSSFTTTLLCSNYSVHGYCVEFRLKAGNIVRFVTKHD